MDAYRIGYIIEPWINQTPPIRGGVYRKTTVDAEEDTSSSVGSDQAYDSDCVSVNSSATSLDSPASSIAAGHESKNYLPSGHQAEAEHGEAVGLRRRGEKEISETLIVSQLSPEAYIASAIRGEIEDGIRSSPSLDQKTQQSINLKYQKLHQRVKDEGFYQCRYIEYGKEAVRYSLLFVASMYALRQEWYITSACFLGLFWVSNILMVLWLELTLE